MKWIFPLFLPISASHGNYKDCLSPMVCILQQMEGHISAWKGTLQVLSIKDCHLAGTRKCTCSVMAPALWDAVPSETRLALTCCLSGYCQKPVICQALGVVKLVKPGWVNIVFIYPLWRNG